MRDSAVVFYSINPLGWMVVCQFGRGGSRGKRGFVMGETIGISIC